MLGLRRILRPSSRQSLLPSYTFDMSELSLYRELDQPPPAYFPSSSPPPYSEPSPRPHSRAAPTQVLHQVYTTHRTRQTGFWLVKRHFMEWVFRGCCPVDDMLCSRLLLPQWIVHIGRRMTSLPTSMLALISLHSMPFPIAALRVLPTEHD
ncbi:hypothetical protein EDD16DRAFT_965818 [Pisolithus croceorrhizus]|nr:hypothetical protein EDD16DRAFT_965818 [Pisolithus croceorrhizus]